MNTSDLFDLGQTAEAAYANFINSDGDLLTLDDDVKAALKSLGFSETQATNFVAEWSVVAHQPNTESGFSATLFQHKETGEQVYAVRGTEATNIGILDDLFSADAGDIVVDGLAIKQMVDMYNHWQRLNHPLGDPYPGP